jgi:hypothetical protein
VKINAFIFRVFLFLAPTLILIVLAELLVRKIPNEYRYKRHYLVQHAEETEILILGNSHSYYGVNPNHFDATTFNASHISQSLNFDFQILKLYEGQWKSIKTIILQVSYLTMAEKLEAGPEAWRVKNYTIYYGINEFSGWRDYFEVTSMEPDYILSRIRNHYINHSSQIACDGTGFGKYCLNRKWDMDSTKAAETVARHTLTNSAEGSLIERNNKQCVEDIIQWSRERDISMLLYRPPATVEYQQLVKDDQLIKMTEVVEGMLKKYHNCSYADFYDSKAFAPSDFCDADHLNESGAAKLSAFLNLRISVPSTPAPLIHE